jgi:hypothetical protein
MRRRKDARRFFRNSRSMRRGSFSRRGRAISAARSAPADGDRRGALEYPCGDPAFPRSPAFRQARSLEAAIPSSRAIWLNDRCCLPAVLPTPAIRAFNANFGLQDCDAPTDSAALAAGQYPSVNLTSTPWDLGFA